MASKPTELTVETASERDAAGWNRYVESHPMADLSHRFEWKTVLETAYRKECHYLCAIADHECQGILPLVHMPGFLSGNRLVSMPFLDQGGVLGSSPDVESALWGAALRLADRLHVNGIDVRNPPTANALLSGDEARFTLTLRLPSSTETLWKSFRPKVRNQIRKAEKEHLKTERADLGRLAEFYSVFCENMRDLGSPTHSLDFLRGVFEAFGNDAQLYLTEKPGGGVVGGAVGLRSGATLTVPWASSLREVFKSCPNHSLYWKILSEAVEAGDQVFDFGRSVIDSGTYRFKKQWGAEPRALNWKSFNRQGVPTPEDLFRPSSHLAAVRIWSRLPLSLTNWLGPRVRRHLSN